MMRRWKAFGKAVASLGLAVSVSACANAMDFLGGGGETSASNSFAGGSNAPGYSPDGQSGDKAEQPSFAALYQTERGPMLYRSGKLYSLSTGAPKLWGPAPEPGMAWSLAMVSAQDAWSVGPEGIARYTHQGWKAVLTSADPMLAPSASHGAAVLLTDVAFADAETGFAVGTQGTVLRYADGTWSKLSDELLKGKNFGTVRLGSGSEVWVAGEDVLRFDGTQWTRIGLPEEGAAVSGLLILSDAVWASTGDGLWRWDRTSGAWSEPQPDLVQGFVGAPQPVPGGTGTLRGWAMDVGTPGGTLYQLDHAGTWTKASVTSAPSVGLDALVLLDEETGFALSFDGFTLYRIKQGTWSRISG